MEFLNEIFDNREKPISENSRKLYIHNLMKLNNNEPITNLNFLNDINTVLSKLSKYKPTTIRSYIIAICTVLKKNNEKLYNQYYEIKSSQVLLFSEARKPFAEAAGHGRRGWCARVWSPPPPGLSKESGER